MKMWQRNFGIILGFSVANDQPIQPLRSSIKNFKQNLKTLHACKFGLRICDVSHQFQQKKNIYTLELMIPCVLLVDLSLPSQNSLPSLDGAY